MPARIVTYLPMMLALLSASCRYADRNQTKIRQALSSNTAALAAFEAWLTACRDFILPLNDLVQTR
jgi:hypothetical protein